MGITTSTKEAELVALYDGVLETDWVGRLLDAFEIDHTEPAPLYCDDRAAVALVAGTKVTARQEEVDRHRFEVLPRETPRGAISTRLVDIRRRQCTGSPHKAALGTQDTGASVETRLRS